MQNYPMDSHHKPQGALRLMIMGVTGIAAVSGLAALVYGYVRIQELTQSVQHLTSELASTTNTLSVRDDAFKNDLAMLDAKAIGLGTSLATTEQELRATQSNVNDVRTQVGGVATTVITLEKLTKMDPELLQKYSRVFFLNEHYTPERVAEVDKRYLYSETHPEVIHAQVLPYLTAMLNASEAVKVNLYVKSAYRGFDEQKSLKSAYSVTYGAGTANAFSADQGYSEHQLGTTVDFMTSGIRGQLESFGNTPAHNWLKANAHRYGFMLSYPPNNKYYVYEPWHWRYVGVKLATYLHDNNKYFYDMEQRDIDTYLVDLF